MGFDVQNTILGKYVYKENAIIVCGCEDFTDEDNILYEFENLVLSTNPNKKIETDLEDIIEVIKENKTINTEETISKFWDMFVIDAIIGNTDRHNGNWGFILNKKTNIIKFSPIYDCGSCLNPLLDDIEIEKINETEIKYLATNCYSCIKENNEKINYMLYIKNIKNNELNKAICRMFKKIDINKINVFIDEIENMSIIRKNFYKKLIEIRYKIIKDTYNKLINI